VCVPQDQAERLHNMASVSGSQPGGTHMPWSEHTRGGSHESQLGRASVDGSPASGVEAAHGGPSSPPHAASTESRMRRDIGLV